MNNVLLIFLIIILGCESTNNTDYSNPNQKDDNNPYVLVLGIAQDAGYPQAGCYAPHCMRAWKDVSLRRSATCIALINPETKQKWLFEATPNIKEQLYQLNLHAPDSIYDLSGIFLTHGHIGHYSGLVHFGREVMGSKGINVFAMPRMKEFLTTNGPWSQLVELNNITLNPLNDSTSITLTLDTNVMPFLVPHRGEFTETVGYNIKTRDQSLIFIPDIDKWEKWEVDITTVVKSHDYALLDATFYDNSELPGRNMAEIPHPFVVESMEVFKNLKDKDKGKIHFIHFNHSNPLLLPDSEARTLIQQKYKLAEEGMILPM